MLATKLAKLYWFYMFFLDCGLPIGFDSVFDVNAAISSNNNLYVGLDTGLDVG
jgi:hypothetical protein